MDVAKSIFIGGTGSNAGKSWMATALCAWLRRQGVRVAPFKAQNMSNHSYPCVGGGEIGRAQVAQADACGLEPEPAMNPILLKPNSNGTSQVVLHGRVWKTLSARDYYAQFETLLPEVLAAYDDLSRRFDAVVIEGAGSVSEINLRPFDLVNLGLVTRIQSPWILVADIERGGVFGSVAGTAALLTAGERALFRGFAINKFRGDPSLFDGGRLLLEAHAGASCLGVFPYAETIEIDAEDSLALDVSHRGRRPAPPAGASVAIIRFPRLSNGTDFRLLPWADWIATPPTQDYDFVVLPGSKDTIADLAWLRRQGLDGWILAEHARGATVLGICGGFQMLGETISDPDGVESTAARARGLGLLPVDTILAPDKVTRRCTGTTPGGVAFSAYEIHLGVTTSSRALAPFGYTDGGIPEGVRVGRVWGTYLHGALEDADVCCEIFNTSVQPATPKSEVYSALADWFERYAVDPASWLG
ncbi:MAG: cobyric acid synthase [Acidobacteriota bacterium]